MQKVKMLNCNLTCTVTMSDECVEFARFFYEGGTTYEVFQHYFEELVETLQLKYPQHTLFFVLDNLGVLFFYT